MPTIFIPNDPSDSEPEENGWVGNAWSLLDQIELAGSLDGIAIHSYGWSFFTPLIATDRKSVV